MEQMRKQLVTALNRSGKLNEKEKQIGEMAKKYNFYPDDVIGCMVLPKICPFDAEGICPHNRLLTIDDDDHPFGFIITWFNEVLREIQIKFIFLIPEARQKGIFTRFIDKIKNQKELDIKKIHLDTHEEGMIRACNKNGFKLIRKCDNGKDLLFTWCRD